MTLQARIQILQAKQQEIEFLEKYSAWFKQIPVDDGFQKLHDELSALIENAIAGKIMEIERSVDVHLAPTVVAVQDDLVKARFEKEWLERVGNVTLVINVPGQEIPATAELIGIRYPKLEVRFAGQEKTFFVPVEHVSKIEPK